MWQFTDLKIQLNHLESSFKVESVYPILIVAENFSESLGTLHLTRHVPESVSGHCGSGRSLSSGFGQLPRKNMFSSHNREATPLFLTFAGYGRTSRTGVCPQQQTKTDCSLGSKKKQPVIECLSRRHGNSVHHKRWWVNLFGARWKQAGF